MNLPALLPLVVTWATLAMILHLPSPHRVFLLHLGRPPTEAERQAVRRAAVVTHGSALAALALGLAGPLAGARLVAYTVAIYVPLAWVLVASARALAHATPATLPGRYRVRVDASLRARDLATPAIQAINAVVVLGTAAAWVLLRPEVDLPLHFDAAGRVDRTGPPGELVVFVLTQLGLTGLMWGMMHAAAHERVAVPPEAPPEVDALVQQRRRLLAAAGEHAMVSTNLGMGALLVGILVGHAAAGEAGVSTGAGLGALVMVGSTLVAMATTLPPLVRNQDALQAAGVAPAAGTRPEGWVWHGAFYYAPDDPALFVPKRVGIGSTLNFARPAAWAILAALMLGLPGMILGVTALSG